MSFLVRVLARHMGGSYTGCTGTLSSGSLQAAPRRLGIGQGEHGWTFREKWV